MSDGKPKFATPKILEEKIQSWLKYCDEKGELPTKGNLALYLKTTRDVLGDYEKKEGYSNAIKEAYATIENAWVQRLKGQSVAGVIFYLKNAFKKDWRDRHETDITTDGKPIVLPSEIIKQNVTVDPSPENYRERPAQVQGH